MTRFECKDCPEWKKPTGKQQEYGECSAYGYLVKGKEVRRNPACVELEAEFKTKLIKRGNR